MKRQAFQLKVYDFSSGDVYKKNTVREAILDSCLVSLRFQNETVTNITFLQSVDSFIDALFRHRQDFDSWLDLMASRELEHLSVDRPSGDEASLNTHVVVNHDCVRMCHVFRGDGEGNNL